MNMIARWLLVFTATAAVLSGGWLARSRLLSASRQRLAQQHIQRVGLLSDQEAARLIARLATSDAEWLEVIVAAWCDERAEVSAAAASGLNDLVGSWSALAISERSERAGELARLLAKGGPSVPAERRHLARSLAQRMIVWPVDPMAVDPASFIADCQSVLLLPVAEPSEIRIAAAPEPRATEPTLVEPQATEIRPAEPATLQEPTPSLPGEPRRLEIPSVRRISDC